MAKSKILLVQVTDNVIGEPALIPGLQRDLEHAKTRSNTTEGSKMGSITQSGGLAETVSGSFLFKRGDEGQKELERAIDEAKEVKIWIIDPEANAEGTYDSKFGYAVMGDFTRSMPYEGVEEISVEMAVQIRSADGVFTALPEGLEGFAEYGFELPGEYTGDHLSRTTTGEAGAAAAGVEGEGI
ncbi:MAG: phage major tail protein, TP901-1 family [Solibacillus sp.]|uniref:phage major tail protein, TP901-1 family n=1 Tax=Solibacillus sp. TaxID=1909654 RepID=UPI0033160B73